MSYSKENFEEVTKLIESRRTEAEQTAAMREAEIKVKLPEYAALSDELATTSSQIYGVITGAPDKIDSGIEKIRKNNIKIQKKMKKLLTDNGYEADYTEPKYHCRECSDTGYINGRMCLCMKKELVIASIKSSGIGFLIENQTFENFSLSYYKGKDKEIISGNLDFCKSYAEDFGEGSPSLLFIGATGLGKTHLSTAIAGQVIKDGFDVVYETAQNIFFDFEQNRFKNTSYEETLSTDRYFETDLLIIDDLGAEVTNRFTVACLYNIINTRINKGLATIINTNLDQHEIRDRYEDRITSRLFGEFVPLFFTGKDVRAQKING